MKTNNASAKIAAPSLKRISRLVDNMKTRMKLLLAVVLIAVAAGPAYPEDKTLLQLQVDVISLAKKVDQVQAAVDQNNAVMKGLVEKMYDQVSGLSNAVGKISQTVDGLKSQNDASTKE